MELKSLFRNLCLGLEKDSQETQAAKALLDQAQLVLQNILYEKRFYLSETRAILDYPSKYTKEQVGLMPVEQFQATAPASFREGAATPHEVMCRRLAHEKHARGEAVAQLEQLKGRRDALAAVATSRWELLGSLQDELNAVAAAAAPIRAKLGAQSAAGRSGAAADAARTLPPPLLNAYTLLSAAVHGFGLRATVSVKGAADGLPAEAGAADVPEGAAEGPPGKRARPESAADGAPPAKRGRSQRLDPSPGATPPAAAAPAGGGGTGGGGGGDGAFAAAPQEVVVELAPAPAATNPTSTPAVAPKGVTLRLRWVPDLLAACAACDDAGHDAQLRELFPGDDGARAPSAAAMAAAAAAAGGAVDWGALQAGRPFRWAQRVCGMDASSSLAVPGDTSGGASGPAAALPQADPSGSALGVQALLLRLVSLAGWVS
ncbi:hypothetical protein WJX81_003025 [Elliptochloris bilobata]|uniref:THO complex subunit 5 n=1 Tax=Elliptochloris bilobata TaxID=381761 RepID=A0AAW1RW04_9CHLO